MNICSSSELKLPGLDSFLHPRKYGSNLAPARQRSTKPDRARFKSLMALTEAQKAKMGSLETDLEKQKADMYYIYIYFI